MIGRWKRRLGVLTAVVAVVALAVVLLRYLPPYLRYRHVEGLLAGFRANPGQQTADPLIDLLVKSEVPQEQGDRILATLLESIITVKDSFEPGEAVDPDVTARCPLKLTGLTGDATLRVDVDGLSPPGTVLLCQDNMGMVFHLGQSKLLYLNLNTTSPDVYPLAAEAGRYRGVVRFEAWPTKDVPYPVIVFPGNLDPWYRRLWRALVSSRERQALEYHFCQSVPFQIQVVPATATMPATAP